MKFYSLAFLVLSLGMVSESSFAAAKCQESKTTEYGPTGMTNRSTGKKICGFETTTVNADCTKTISPITYSDCPDGSSPKGKITSGGAVGTQGRNEIRSGLGSTPVLTPPVNTGSGSKSLIGN